MGAAFNAQKAFEHQCVGLDTDVILVISTTKSGFLIFQQKRNTVMEMFMNIVTADTDDKHKVSKKKMIVRYIDCSFE